MIYVDANVFIYPVIYDENIEKKAKLSKKILIKIAKGKIKAVTSTLSWDELVWVVRKVLGNSIAMMQGEKFLKFPNLKFLNIDVKVITKAQKLVEKYNLKPRDAIHVSCALLNKIKKILSDDLDFDKVKEIKRIELEKTI